MNNDASSVVSDQMLDTIVGQTPRGSPVYLRDVFEVHRGYEDPIPFTVDVLHRQDSLASGDLRYDLNPGQKHMWRASEIIPFGATAPTS